MKLQKHTVPLPQTYEETPETFQKMQTHEKQTWLSKFTINKNVMGKGMV